MPRGSRTRLLRALTTAAAAIAVAAAVAAPPSAPQDGSSTQHLAAAPAASSRPLPGQDISWPQCPKGMGRGKGAPIPVLTRYVSGTRFTVIGVNQGKPFYANPCLKSLVAYARRTHQYAAAYTLPAPPVGTQLSTYGQRGPYRGDDTATKMRNFGYAQAAWTVTNMHSQGFYPRFIWLDVEPLKLRHWNTTTATARMNNRAVIQGMRSAFARAGISSGFYTTDRFWLSIVGRWRTSVPVWAAYSVSSQSAARRHCSTRQASGGPVAMVQYYHFNPLLDVDVTCPAMSRLGGWRHFFVKY